MTSDSELIARVMLALAVSLHRSSLSVALAARQAAELHEKLEALDALIRSHEIAEAAVARAIRHEETP